jgi:phosphate-selective porin OprO/OprP
VSPGQQRFFSYRTGAGTNDATASVVANGDHWRLSPQGYYYWGPFGLFGEYVISDQELQRTAGAATYQRVRNTAWQVATSYFLTGEENSYKPVAPKRPVSLHGGGWGALEVAARIQQLNVDDAAFPLLANPATAAREALSWGLGLNWHLNRNLKFNVDYEQTNFKGGGSSAFLREGEKVILTRIQFSF